MRVREASDTLLVVDAGCARRLLLAQAVDESDTEGRFVSAVEREQLEREALHAVAGAQPAQAPEPGPYLDERARRLIDIVRRRDPRLASLEHAEPWQRWLGWGLPLLALALGAGLERIDNPAQVNLLSPPLLAFLFWNLLIYLGLLLRPLWNRRRRSSGPGGLAALLRELLGHRSEPRGRRVRADVFTRFHAQWWRIAGPLEGWRVARILHVSSAAWAVGVGLSIVLGGLVREYRVGWESTLLDLPQVHALLSVLFAPVVAVLPLEGFTLAELERLHFRSGVAVGQAEARHWIALYLGLLGLLVVLPRTLLALYAGARRRWLARSLQIDLNEPYFTQVLARVSPARVAIVWAAAEPPLRERLRRLWAEASLSPGAPEAAAAPIRTDRGDELLAGEFVPALDAPASEAVKEAPRIAEAPSSTGAASAAATVPAAARSPARWLARLQAWWEPPARAALTVPRPLADLWLVALGTSQELETILPHLHALPRPVILLLADPAQEASVCATADTARLPFECLPLHASMGVWAWEEPLREAIARHLPQHKAAGAQRLFATWRTRHEDRLQQAMTLLAEPLQQAAADVQTVASGPLGWRRIVDAGEREAGVQAREEAMAGLMQRLAQSQARSMTQLRRLHGLPPAPAQDAAAWRTDRFVVRQSVDAPQAGMAGAASGAAAGVGIDLITGGLSLGAGAALGALVGGGAAFVAAALKNRAAPGGGTLVQLSEPMLQALCEMSLLQYLAVVMRGDADSDAGSGPEAVPAAWRSEVVACVERRRPQLHALWQRLRSQPPDVKAPGELAGLLASLAREVMGRLRN
ncbi:DUF3482 domain-containing protein [Ramlibacter rhizophilus]|uniref:DUF3482 domain-containing protein n=1 Tax=Ramlibacter rhizophilus TaxID=1781167 RepID=A0A4Z0BLW5_9BURK|nr:DUF3482 domain-containing protein [Ramlibacter rhizophilus]TFY99751.1 DUF3482 domain-containing protein [Ramlibacter rhizophilus]